MAPGLAAVPRSSRSDRAGTGIGTSCPLRCPLGDRPRSRRLGGALRLCRLAHASPAHPGNPALLSGLRTSPGQTRTSTSTPHRLSKQLRLPPERARVRAAARRHVRPRPPRRRAQDVQPRRRAGQDHLRPRPHPGARADEADAQRPERGRFARITFAGRFGGVRARGSADRCRRARP
jgi:hypothetical protein